MRLFRKIKWMKRVYQFLFAFNVMLIVAGGVDLVEFLKNNQISALQMALIGGTTLLVGILVPLFILRSLAKAAALARTQTEEAAARLISGWIGYQDATRGTADPVFWMKMFLLGAEIWAENTAHPVGKTLAQFVPVLRKELESKPGPKRRKKRGKIKKTGQALPPTEAA